MKLLAVTRVRKDNGLMTLYAHMTEKAPPFNPQLKIPDWLAKVVLKCLEKDPDKRFQNADELSCELSKGLGRKHDTLLD